MSSRVAAHAAWLFACVLASCSFMGLDDYELRACEPRAPCDGLNARLLAGQCEEYVCDESGLGCVLKPRDRDHDGHLDPIACADREDLEPLDCEDDNDQRNAGLDEKCDGIDNDCDDWIDEGNEREPDPDEADPIRLDDDLEHLSVSMADEDTLYAALTFSDDLPELWTLIDGVRTKTDTATPDDVTACHIDGMSESRCNFGQISIAAAGQALFAAGVGHGGCGSGRLRVAGSADPSLAGLPETEDDLSFGVDIQSDGCTASTACSGVSEPVVAALPALGSEPSHALVVWNAPLEASACPRWCADCERSGPVEVAALGMQLGEPIAEMESRPSEPLGVADAGGAPAVVAWWGAGMEGGYFIAFAGSGQLELRFVPRLAGPAASVRQGLLEGGVAAPGASHVALALDASATDAPRGLGVAYRTAGGTAVAFVPLEFDRDADAALSASIPPLEFEAAEPITSGPVLAYARDGFFESEDARKTGGWLLMWIEGAQGASLRLMAARIALTGTHRLGRPIELARRELSWPFAYVNQIIDGRDELAYGFVQDRDLHLRRLTCNPMQ